MNGWHIICFLIVVFAYIEHNNAATKVLYEFHIREVHSERNETGSLNTSNNKTGEPELIITGKRSSQLILPGKDLNSSSTVYNELVVYTADDSGYHVKYNISIRPLDLDTRLGGKTLKVIVG
ncbi:uncharacterized protein LOC135436365 [Drosophila montana]|uniref:uncharacterized protein LOC135436365 n=1 Tax=Drosophila montana TaxID=40370 RepID=UPI00313E07BF